MLELSFFAAHWLRLNWVLAIRLPWVCKSALKMQTFTEVRLFPVREFRIFYLCVRNSSIMEYNLGPRVFSDKAADEDPGKIHFIFPKFWGKRRMRSEAQRMLLIKNNDGACYFWNKLRSIFKNYLLISWDTARYDCSFLSSHLTLTIIRYVKTYSLRQSSKMMQQCPAFNTASKVKCF